MSSPTVGFRPTLSSVIDVMSDKGYRVFNTPSKPFNLNIVGVRTKSKVPETFDDWITVFYRSNNHWIFNAFPATTDPGLYYLGDEMGTERGTAILKEGQYRSAYEIGKHQGRYKALCQKDGPDGKVTVIRDFDQDRRLDYDTGREETGNFGINIHRANVAGASVNVGRWSAGCQVICDPFQFNYFLDLCERGRKVFGNSFTYTLLHQRDFE